MKKINFLLPLSLFILSILILNTSCSAPGTGEIRPLGGEYHSQTTSRAGQSEITDKLILLPDEVKKFMATLNDNLQTVYTTTIEPHSAGIYEKIYLVTIKREPIDIIWPKYHNFLVSAKFLIYYYPGIGDVTGKVLVKHSSFSAEYDKADNLDSQLLLDGLCQYKGVTHAAACIMGLLEDIAVKKNETDLICFRYLNSKGTIGRNEEGKIITSEDEYLTSLSGFEKGLAGCNSYYKATITKALDAKNLTPIQYNIYYRRNVKCLTSRCISPGDLIELKIRGIDSFASIFDQEAELDLLSSSLNAYYQDFDVIPDSTLLYRGMLLLLKKSGLKTVYNYHIIGEMSKIKVLKINKTGTAMVFAAPDGSHFMIEKNNNEVTLTPIKA